MERFCYNWKDNSPFFEFFWIKGCLSSYLTEMRFEGFIARHFYRKLEHYLDRLGGIGG